MIVLEWKDKRKGRAEIRIGDMKITLIRAKRWYVDPWSLPSGLRKRLEHIALNFANDGEKIGAPGDPGFREAVEAAHKELLETASRVAREYERWKVAKEQDEAWLAAGPQKWIWDPEAKRFERLE